MSPIDRIYDERNRRIYEGFDDPRYVVLSRETWAQVLREVLREANYEYMITPDEANGFRLLGMTVVIAPVDDEIFLA